MIQYIVVGSLFIDWYLGQGVQFIGDLNVDGIDDLVFGVLGVGVGVW